MRKVLFILFLIANLSQAKEILKDKFGNPINLPKDKIILINFIAYSCGHCMAEIPIIKKILKEDEFKNKVIVIAFAIDGKENNFKDKEYPIYANHPENQVRFPIFGTPTSYIITAEGKKLAVIYGSLTEKNLREYLREALKKVGNAPGRT